MHACVLHAHLLRTYPRLALLLAGLSKPLARCSSVCAAGEQARGLCFVAGQTLAIDLRELLAVALSGQGMERAIVSEAHAVLTPN